MVQIILRKLSPLFSLFIQRSVVCYIKKVNAEGERGNKYIWLQRFLTGTGDRQQQL